MNTSTLFVIGLVVGALCVFAIRAIDLDGAESAADQPTTPSDHSHAPAAAPAPASSEPAPAPAPAAPAPAPAPAQTPDPAADDRAPENEICPVMGHEVDPDIYVDYEGRRIGFCCAGCDKTFLEDPEKYLKKVDAELAARKGGK